MERDPYKILGIAPLSSENEISKAYRKKTKLYNPDLNPGARVVADKIMKELTEAYTLLSDPQQRKDYDNSPHLQIRRVRKLHARITKKISADQFMDGKPAFKESSSLLDRIKSFFQKPHEIQKTTDYNPKEADMHFALGISLCDNIKFIEQAPSEFQKAIQYDPNHLEAHYNMGIVYYKTGQFEEASICFQKVLGIDRVDKGSLIMVNLLKDD